MSVVLKEYGHTADGTPVQLAILNNGQIEVHILSYAAAIQKLFVPDSKGRKVDVVLVLTTWPAMRQTAVRWVRLWAGLPPDCRRALL